MTTAVRIPDHGTPYRYKGPRNGSWAPCRCKACTRAHGRSCALRAIAHLAGQPPLYPGEPLRQHIATLTEASMSYGLIARRAHVAPATVSYLMRGLTKNVRRDKALRILAVTPGDFDGIADRPALPSMRRTRAMYFLGHNPHAISAASGLDPSTISHIANGRYQTVAATTAAAISAAYRTLHTRPGDSFKARRRAAIEGWHGPLAWDNIDDPAAVPDANDEPEARLTRDELAALRRQEIAHLATGGGADEEIAQRVGLSASSVRTIRGELRTGHRRDRKQAAA